MPALQAGPLEANVAVRRHRQGDQGDGGADRLAKLRVSRMKTKGTLAAEQSNGRVHRRDDQPLPDCSKLV